jgi:hypothetical protein
MQNIEIQEAEGELISPQTERERSTRRRQSKGREIHDQGGRSKDRQ